MSHNPEQTPRKMGITMMVFAWGVLFLMLVLFFDDVLDQQNNPNQSPNSKKIDGRIELVLQANRQHHYVISGQINQQNVTFLLDTGATDVVVPAKLAQRLQLEKGPRSYAHTANGTITIYRTEIDQLQLGDIILEKIPASINPHMDGDVILLGMSALRQLEFTQRGDALILRQ